MALADMTDGQFDTYLLTLSQATLTAKKSSYTTVDTTIGTETTALDAKRAQLHAHAVKIDAALKHIATLETFEDARFADYETRIAALEAS